MANEHRRSTIPTLKAAIAAAKESGVDVVIRVDRLGNMEITTGKPTTPDAATDFDKWAERHADKT